MRIFLIVLAVVFAWIGHAYLWTALLNNIYGRPLPKRFLKLWRYGTALLILAFPILVARALRLESLGDGLRPINDIWDGVVLGYVALCLFLGAVVYPAVNIARLMRSPPPTVLSELTHTLDLWPQLGAKLYGDGKLSALTRLPGNGVFRVDFTDLTLALPELPPEWDGLTLQVVSDLHFHGTPSRDFFERVIDDLTSSPTPDLVCLLGDFVDTDKHRDWIQPLLGRLSAREGKFAILGNHDRNHDPGRVRHELAAAGYEVLGNSWEEVMIRGVPGVLVGHEGPWFRPGPDLSDAPKESFRLCLSHTPDNFYWGIAHRINLMLCGHVHGGSIRLPIIGSIFVPSIYGRRFDNGVFEQRGTVMIVNRGLSGREPIRFRCNPQVIQMKLVRRGKDPR